MAKYFSYIIFSDHIQVDNSSLPKCCLASAYLVSRICAKCPIQVFKSTNLVNELSELLCRGWYLSPISDNQSNGVMNKDANSLENPLMDISKLFESKLLQNRIICLRSFGLLCNHHESSIRSLFIKTLTPQVSKYFSLNYFAFLYVTEHLLCLQHTTFGLIVVKSSLLL